MVEIRPRRLLSTCVVAGISLLASGSVPAATKEQIAVNSILESFGMRATPEFCVTDASEINDAQKSCRSLIPQHLRKHFIEDKEVDLCSEQAVNEYLSAQRDSKMEAVKCMKALSEEGANSPKIQEALGDLVAIQLNQLADLSQRYIQKCGESFYCRTAQAAESFYYCDSNWYREQCQGSQRRKANESRCKAMASIQEASQGLGIKPVGGFIFGQRGSALQPGRDFDCAPGHSKDGPTLYTKIQSAWESLDYEPMSQLRNRVLRGDHVNYSSTSNILFDSEYYKKRFQEDGLGKYLSHLKTSAQKLKQEVCGQPRAGGCLPANQLASDVQLSLLGVDSKQIFTDSGNFVSQFTSQPEAADFFRVGFICPKVSELVAEERLKGAAILGVGFLPLIGQSGRIFSVASKMKAIEKVGTVTAKSAAIRGAVGLGYSVDTAMIYQSCRPFFKTELRSETCKQDLLNRIQGEACVAAVVTYGSLMAAPYLPGYLKQLVPLSAPTVNILIEHQKRSGAN